MASIKSKRWLFTLNNYTEQEIAAIVSSKNSKEEFKYLIFGKEIGEQGTPHLQGYMETSVRCGLRRVKSLLCSQRVHVEKARGSLESNQTYCKKEGDFIELGAPIPTQVRVIDYSQVLTWD
jgi:hypothetical protein